MLLQSVCSFPLVVDKGNGSSWTTCKVHGSVVAPVQNTYIALSCSAYNPRFVPNYRKEHLPPTKLTLLSRCCIIAEVTGLICTQNNV